MKETLQMACFQDKASTILLEMANFPFIKVTLSQVLLFLTPIFIHTSRKLLQ